MNRNQLVQLPPIKPTIIMGHMRCEKHGGAGPLWICKCLDQQATQGLFPAMYDIEGHDIVCQSCAEVICTYFNPINVTLETLVDFDDTNEVIEFSDEDEVLFRERYHKYSHLFCQDGTYWCALCYWDFKVKRARHENKPITSDVYEKTLEFQDQAIIDKLHEYLLSAYPFKLKLYDDNYNYSYSLPNTKGIKALEVYKGHILRPLAISVWYVTEKEEQDLVLNIIEQFFQQEAKYQRKVIFYKAETPRIEVENDEEEYRHTTKEDEVVLLEILIA